MPEIIKTEALVLRKIDFGDTSNIGSFYTKELGKISAMIKGARSPKSKYGRLADVLNRVEIIIYKKENRDVQLISQVDLINHYSGIKEDLEKLKYASAILELLNEFILENETNDRLFRGTVKILDLMNSGENPLLNFSKYFLFFISEIGFELELTNCRSCGNEITQQNRNGFNFESGIYCRECSKEHLISFEFSAELFESLICLSSKRNASSVNNDSLKKVVNFLEKFLIYHMSEFKGLQSLKMF